MRLLSLVGVTKSYGAVQALRGVSLDVRGAEVHALMGENGAGKSTLIRILSGLERPDSGQLLLDAAPLVLQSPQQAQASGLRVLHQELHVVPGLSVAENMHLHRRFPRRLGLVDWRGLNAAARVALDRLGLDHIDPRLPMGRLPTGDRMLSRIAATLVGADVPWLLILDEPTAALTPPESARLFSVIAEMKAQGAGILYVSHRMAEVMHLADRISVLRDGALVSSRPRNEASEQQLIEDMTGRLPRDLFPTRRKTVPAPPVLRVRGLRSSVLQGIDLDLVPGEVLGLAGLAGSGRGHLLRALIGAVPRSGDFNLAGKPLPASPQRAWAAGMAYIPRERRAEGLMLRRPITETVTLPHLRALGGWLIKRRAERTFMAWTGARVRLKAAGPHVPAAALSGGNQQKLLFARAIGANPKVLLLDDPTRGVDVGARADLYQLIRDLAEAGTAVLLVSSDLPELIGLSDRVAIVQGGRITQVLDADGLTEASLLAQTYKGTP